MLTTQHKKHQSTFYLFFSDPEARKIHQTEPKSTLFCQFPPFSCYSDECESLLGKKDLHLSRHGKKRPSKIIKRLIEPTL